jgi:lysophospholipase L1-like esterase
MDYMPPRRRCRCAAAWALALCCALALLGPAPLIGRAHAAQTYLALGDSFAFGITTYADALATGPTLADQGYVRPFANFLATQNNGVRPNVLNLSIPGETTASFFTGGSVFTSLNLNYAPTFTSTQAQQVSARIAAERAAGNTINNVSLQLGGNDLLDVALNPAFAALPPASQVAQINALLPTVQANYVSALGLIRAQAPEARIFLVGYFDPFPGLGAANPYPLTSPLLVQSLNGVIAGVAAASGATFVDVYPDFVGREAQLTNITGPLNPLNPQSPPNYHPNAAGYQVIANRLVVAATIPEPGSLLLLAGAGLPALHLGVRRWRTRWGA